MPSSDESSFVTWFRSVAPYFHAFRGQTFVIAFGGELVAEGRFGTLASDLNLLRAAGIRLVLVHGARPQIEARLKARKVRSRYHRGLRITDPVALDGVKEAVGLLRVEIDAALSLGLPNTPMAGAAINTVSGNFISAQPLGVHDGVDYQHTGSVRKVNARAIAGSLDAGNIVVISPLGYSPTGEVFNLTMEDVALATAAALRAPKLVYFSETAVVDRDGGLRRELTANEAERVLADGAHLSASTRTLLGRAIAAVRAGVERAHLIQRAVDGALLIELFTHSGAGSMITADKLEQLRGATIDDVGGILQLLEPLERDGTLVRRGRELLEQEIARFTLIEHDRLIFGCAALYPFPKARAGELACLAVRPEYRGLRHGDKLLAAIERQARNANMSKLFVLTTRTAHWFVEHGFHEVTVEDLPIEKRALYNWQRRSKVLMKPLR